MISIGVWEKTLTVFRKRDGMNIWEETPLSIRVRTYAPHYKRCVLMCNTLDLDTHISLPTNFSVERVEPFEVLSFGSHFGHTAQRIVMCYVNVTRMGYHKKWERAHAFLLI